MNSPTPKFRADRIIVMMPNWLGDAVMATPFLRALRSLYPDAHIAAIGRPLVAPVLSGLPFVNDLHILDKANPGETLRYLRSNRFDLGILLPNSFRSAWMLFRGGVKRRLGYARGFRSLLVHDRVAPLLRTHEQKARDDAKRESIRQIAKQLGQAAAPAIGSPFQPVPTIDYYLKLAEYLGASAGAGKAMEVSIAPKEKAEAEQVLALAGISAGDTLVVIVPGANFGSSKCWPAERFAQVADRIMDRPERGGNFGAHVFLASSPSEMPIVDAILSASHLCPNGEGIGRLHALAKLNDGRGISLGALKEIVRRARLVLCNDTGPRHFAAAFHIPTITLFGPTDPIWAETYSQHERLIRINVPCGPCQLKKCPIDHRCMKGISVEMVMGAVADLWHNQVHPDVAAPQSISPEP